MLTIPYRTSLKALLTLTLSLGIAHSAQATPNFPALFPQQDACFILYNLNQRKVVALYNKPLCKTEVSPNSTFKVALSLMAFDSHVITQQTVFKWNDEHHSIPEWNHDQTPQTWLRYSVVWVSQQITPQLGMAKIDHYLDAFDYGNEDFAGDPGQHNGLSRAWLDSSLKISPIEQLKFIGKLVNNKLPVSQTAMTDTKANLYLETSANGWQLYGKTGNGSGDGLQHAWFVGWVQKQGQVDLVVLHTQDLTMPKSNGYASVRDEALVKQILQSEGVF